MIFEKDAKNFALMMKVTWQSYGRNEPDKETMRFWFDKLISNEFSDVANAFDEWLKSQKQLPTVNDIIGLCRHKVTIHARLPSPLAIQDNKRHVDELKQHIADNLKPKTDYKAWAKRILANPKQFPDISLRFAKEALNQPKETK